MTRLALVLWLACLVSARAEDWPQQGGTPDRSGRARERAAPGVATGWSVDLGEPLVAGAVVADGVVVVVAADGTVRGLDEATGAVRWTRELMGSITATPACGRGRVVVASGAGRVTCLAQASGAILWDRPAMGGTPRAAVSIDGTTALVSLGFPVHTVQALGLLDGTLLWTSEASAVSYSPPAVSGGLLIFGADDGSYEARNLGDGSAVWRATTSGRVLLSSATIGGDAAFLLPGGEDARVFSQPLDQTRWASDAWSLVLTDPSPPPGWAILGQTVSTSSPGWTGSRVVGVVRFDYVLDLAEPWFVADTWSQRERAFEVDPVTRSVVWAGDLVQVDATAGHEQAPYGRCQGPLTLDGPAGGQWVAHASSLAARLEWYAAGGGAPVASFELPGQRWAAAGSPALANARVVLCGEAGQVVSLLLGANSAPAAPVLVAGGGGSVSWQPGADAEDAAGSLEHLVRFDDDGEVLLDADAEVWVAGGTTELALPPGLASDRRYTVRVRSRDPQGALSPWSSETTVQLALAPEPARDLSLTPLDATSVQAEWLASPSPFVARYLVSHRVAGGAWSGPADVGLTTMAKVSGLTPDVINEVRVVAVSSLGVESAPVSASLTPGPPIDLGGKKFYSLREALLAARSGDLLFLGPGTFRDAGVLSIPRGVILRGASPHRTRIAGSGLGELLRILAPSAPENGAPTPTRLEKIALFGAERGVVLETGAEVELENVLLYDLQDGLVLGPSSRARVRSFTAVGNRGRGVAVGAGATLELTGGLLVDNDVGLDAGGAVTTAWTATWSNRLDRMGHAPSPTDRVDLEPGFLDAAARDYREAPGSPTIDAGDPALPVGDEPAPNGGRINLGAFGGTAEAATTGSAPALASRSFGGCGLGEGAGDPWAASLVALLLGFVALRSRFSA